MPMFNLNVSLDILKSCLISFKNEKSIIMAIQLIKFGK
jgi:hypothetical protein